MLLCVPVPVPNKSTEQSDVNEVLSPRPKRVRTVNDFLLFCKIILDHENYEVTQQEDQRQDDASRSESTKSLPENSKPKKNTKNVPEYKSSDSDSENVSASQTSRAPHCKSSYDEDSYDLVTCYCSKPFAGRPMIECSKCSTWIHLSCAKVKKNHIPDVFICAKCKNRRVTRVFNLRHKKRYRYTM